MFTFLYSFISWGAHDVPLGPIQARLTLPIMVIAFAVPPAVNTLPFIMSELNHTQPLRHGLTITSAVSSANMGYSSCL